MIRVEDVRKRFPGAAAPTLDGVSFTLETGRLAAILGPSGSGKSTLLRCIVGLERPDSGTIHLGGQAGLVFQSFELFPHLTTLDNCVLAQRLVAKRSRADAEARARQLLEALGLTHRLDAYPDMLSGGQRQRVAIARALAMEPAVLLYDEPTSALDPSLRREVVETLRRVGSLGMTQLVVTHDVALARASEVVLVLDHGHLVEQGPPQQVLDAPRHDATRRLLAQAHD
ncbi:amino acid ABC transporter ATP-binding protein [Archangium violaceum]|uniref:amino acid ABC transporter ATP-binding protein n=1 Tax=Archangium violaceum TaxID=83451 RepID=UPI001950CDDC|nr:amino acid ABC transporter ATP-binding protein [Archangium violaceum]QRN96480.1 amino acid ABC transporter ATP-binding protein [Archangium violaceum]